MPEDNFGGFIGQDNDVCLDVHSKLRMMLLHMRIGRWDVHYPQIVQLVGSPAT